MRASRLLLPLWLLAASAGYAFAQEAPIEQAQPSSPLAPAPHGPPPEKVPPCFLKPATIGSPFGAGVYFEQDGVLPWLTTWNEDRNYTMGLAFPLIGQWIHRAKLDTPLRAADCLSGLNAAHNGQVEAAGRDALQDFSLVFGHTAFTPDRLNEPGIITDDRPYASLLFISTMRTTVDPFQRRVVRSEFTLGMLGLDIGRRVQTYIHQRNRANKGPDAVTPDDPLGWHHQISDGGEPTAKYTISLARAANETLWHDASWHTEASAGYYTNVAVGGLLRAGYLRSPFWALNSNPLTVGNQKFDGATGDLDKDRAKRKFELAGFAAGRLRAVGYNALLQGQFRDTDFTLSSAQVARLVLEGEAGVTLAFGPCTAIGTIARRSGEYLVGVSRSHTYGGVHVVCVKRRKTDG